MLSRREVLFGAAALGLARRAGAAPPALKLAVIELEPVVELVRSSSQWKSVGDQLGKEQRKAKTDAAKTRQLQIRARQELQGRIEALVEAAASARKLDVVLERQSVVYGTPLDLTPDVLRLLKEKPSLLDRPKARKEGVKTLAYVDLEALSDEIHEQAAKQKDLAPDDPFWRDMQDRAGRATARAGEKRKVEAALDRRVLLYGGQDLTGEIKDGLYSAALPKGETAGEGWPTVDLADVTKHVQETESWKAGVAAYVAERTKLDAEVKKLKESGFSGAALQKRESENAEKLRKMEADLLDASQAKVVAAIAAAAKSHSFDLVLDDRAVVYGANDLTPAVVTQLK